MKRICDAERLLLAGCGFVGLVLRGYRLGGSALVGFPYIFSRGLLRVANVV